MTEAAIGSPSKATAVVEKTKVKSDETILAEARQRIKGLQVIIKIQTSLLCSQSSLFWYFLVFKPFHPFHYLSSNFKLVVFSGSNTIFQLRYTCSNKF